MTYLYRKFDMKEYWLYLCTYKRDFICQDWLYNFDNFYIWCLDNKYDFGMIVSRIHKDLPYQPNNCRIVKPRLDKPINSYEIGY